MRVGRWIGWSLLLVACVVLARDGFAWRADGFLQPESVAYLWLDLTGRSLTSLEAGVEGFAPWLWTFVFAPFFSLWAAPTLAVAGLGLLWACRRRAGPRFR